MNESFETPGIGLVTGEEDDFEIAAIRACVSGTEFCKSVAMEANLIAIHPPAANGIDERWRAHASGVEYRWKRIEGI